MTDLLEISVSLVPLLETMISTTHKCFSILLPVKTLLSLPVRMPMATGTRTRWRLISIRQALCCMRKTTLKTLILMPTSSSTTTCRLNGASPLSDHISMVRMRYHSFALHGYGRKATYIVGNSRKKNGWAMSLSTSIKR